MKIVGNTVIPSGRERHDLLIPSFPVEAVPELLGRLDDAIYHQRRFIERRLADHTLPPDDLSAERLMVIPRAAYTMYEFHEELWRRMYPAHECGLESEQETTGFGT